MAGEIKQPDRVPAARAQSLAEAAYGAANTEPVGIDRGDHLETERAEADKKLRQAEAEGRRAMAVAFEQEMKARVQEMQAKVNNRNKKNGVDRQAEVNE